MRLKSALCAVLALLAFGLALPAQAQKTVPDSVPGGIYNSTPPSLSNYQLAPLQLDSSGNLKTTAGPGALTDINITKINGSALTSSSLPVFAPNPFGVFISATSTSNVGITPVATSGTTSTLKLKTSPGNLYSVYANSATSSGAGFLQIFNASSEPLDGAGQTPIDCVPIAAGGTASINYSPGPAGVFSTGIIAVLSSATTCFVKTTGSVLGFIHGSIQ